MLIGTRPVSSGGSSMTWVPEPSSIRPPHCGQNRLSRAMREPQVGQLELLATGANLRGIRLRPQLERAQGLRRAAAKRTDERAVILVGHLPGPLVELELLEGSERAV